MDGRRRGHLKARILRVTAGQGQQRDDLLAIEEPLEIRINTDGVTSPVSITMRTPGADFELAVGFLYSEGIMASASDLERVAYCVDRAAGQPQQYNIVTVHLRDGTSFDHRMLNRKFDISSACGVCGKESLDQVERQGMTRIEGDFQVDYQVIRSLPDILRDSQSLFSKTGGLHAAALFTSSGELLNLQEDVGRHNAVDKVIGWALLQQQLPLSSCLLLVSGRSSFEIAQKCVAAGLPILCSISAPSSLAVELARRFNLTLVGFLREDNLNIYHGANRIVLPAVDV